MFDTNSNSFSTTQDLVSLSNSLQDIDFYIRELDCSHYVLQPKFENSAQVDVIYQTTGLSFHLGGVRLKSLPVMTGQNFYQFYNPHTHKVEPQETLLGSLAIEEIEKLLKTSSNYLSWMWNARAKTLDFVEDTVAAQYKDKVERSKKTKHYKAHFSKRSIIEYYIKLARKNNMPFMDCIQRNAASMIIRESVKSSTTVTSYVK